MTLSQNATLALGMGYWKFATEFVIICVLAKEMEQEKNDIKDRKTEFCPAAL